jgi:hypothetical protein
LNRRFTQEELEAHWKTQAEERQQWREKRWRWAEQQEAEREEKANQNLAHSLAMAMEEIDARRQYEEAFSRTVEAQVRAKTVDTNEKASTVSAPHITWTVPRMAWRDPATITPREYLYGHYYARGVVQATIADGGTGKSILVLAEALAMATGLPLLGIKPTERVRVLYWSGDEDRIEVERRIDAICEQHKIDAKQLMDDGWLFIGTSIEQPLCIAQMERGKVTIDQATADDIAKATTDNNIGLAVFDPFKATHRLPENANMEIDAVADAFKQIAVKTNAALALVHHVRKMAAGQTEITTADARGATALINKVRMSRVLNPMTATLAQQARVSEDERWQYFRIDIGKRNIVPPGKANWFKIISVPCANGQDTPTVVPWKFPGVFDAITTDHMHLVRDKAAKGQYRKDSRSEDWIGRAVAEVTGLDPDDDADLKQIKAMLKVWFSNGVLATEERLDAERHKRVFVVPGDWKESASVPISD